MNKPDYIDKIKSLSIKYKDAVIGWRRHLHEYPELSFAETATSVYIADRLEEIGCDVMRNVGGTGVVGMLDSGQPGPVIAFRADMDALPITEDTGLPYASKNPGIMHACGHDAHMAIVLGLAQVLAQCTNLIKGAVKFIFQPGEEANGGARRMIEAGALSRFILYNATRVLLNVSATAPPTIDAPSRVMCDADAPASPASDAPTRVTCNADAIASPAVNDPTHVICDADAPTSPAVGASTCVIGGADAPVPPAVDAIFALHMNPFLPYGVIATRDGYMTATDDEIKIRVTGKSAHSSTPEDGVNAVLIAANIITALQNIRSSQISPFDVATFSICTIKGGEAMNVIPDSVEMSGMLRCVEKKNILICREKIQNICANTAQALGGEAIIEITEGFPSVFNDSKYTKLLRSSAANVMSKKNIREMPRPLLGSEDFSYYLEQVPGVMFIISSKHKDGHGGSLHTPTLDICEDSLLLGVQIFASLALRLCT